MAEEDAVGSISNIPQNVPLGRLAAVLQYAKEVAATLAAHTEQPMWSAVGRLGELALGRTPETVENYSYGFKPRAEAGPLESVNPANFELAGLAPVGTALKGAAIAGKGAIAAGKGLLAAAPILGGITKGAGLSEDFTKMLKLLAEHHITTPDFTAAHPQLAGFPPEAKALAENFHKNYVDKVNIWGSPEAHANYFATAMGDMPQHWSWADYPPSWQSAVEAEFAKLKGNAPLPAASQFTSAELTPPAPLGATALPAPSPGMGWKQPNGVLAPPPGSTVPSSNALHSGWDVGTPNKGPGATYSTHGSGTKLLYASNGWELEFLDGGKVGPFKTLSHAKHYFHEVDSAGMVPHGAGEGPLGLGKNVVGLSSVPPPPPLFPAQGAGGQPLPGGQPTAGTPSHYIPGSAPGTKSSLPPPWTMAGMGVAEHPSGIKVQLAATGNYHVLDSQGQLLDFESTFQKALDSANAKHIPQPAAVPPPAPAGPLNMSGWKQTGPQAGSNPGGRFEAPDGTTYYAKFPHDEDVARNELLATKLYQEMGIPIPDAQLVMKDGKVGLATKWEEGLQEVPYEQLSATPGAREHFAADAWLANWDVIGRDTHNMVLKNGEAMRVDPGGALRYRGMAGRPKGPAFTDTVGEVESLRTPRNPSTHAVFGSMTDAEVAKSAERVAALHPNRIRELVEEFGPEFASDKTALADKLIARREDLLKRLGIEEPHADLRLKSKYDINEEELLNILKYEPSESPQSILDRYERAKKLWMQRGMTEAEYLNSKDRAAAAGAAPWKLARGSERLNPEPQAPITLPETEWRRYNNSTEWPHPWLFGSEYDPVTRTGSTYYRTSTHKQEELRAIVPENRIFRPDEIKQNPNAQVAQTFEKVYDELKAEEAAGATFSKDFYPNPKTGEGTIFARTGKETVDKWRTLGHSAGYTHAERPAVYLTLERMGFKGITTHEGGGTNYALFHDVPLRWHKAPFDPERLQSQGYFKAGAGVGVGSAALAAALLSREQEGTIQ